MKKLSPTQQHIVDLLKSDDSLFVVESIYWDWNKVTNNDPYYKWESFKRPTFDILVRLGYLIADVDSNVKFKKWILNPDHHA